MDEMNEDKYTTQNLYEAAYLLATGFKLAGKTGDGRKVIVGFTGKGVKDAAMKYYNNGKVSAKKYSDAYRTLKDYVFEKR